MWTAPRGAERRQGGRRRRGSVSWHGACPGHRQRAAGAGPTHYESGRARSYHPQPLVSGDEAMATGRCSWSAWAPDLGLRQLTASCRRPTCRHHRQERSGTFVDSQRPARPDLVARGASAPAGQDAKRAVPTRPGACPRMRRSRGSCQPQWWSGRGRDQRAWRLLRGSPSCRSMQGALSTRLLRGSMPWGSVEMRAVPKDSSTPARRLRARRGTRGRTRPPPGRPSGNRPEPSVHNSGRWPHRWWGSRCLPRHPRTWRSPPWARLLMIFFQKKAEQQSAQGTYGPWFPAAWDSPASNRANTLRQRAGTGTRLLELKPQPIPARSHVESAVHEGKRRHGAPRRRPAHSPIALPRSAKWSSPSFRTQTLVMKLTPHARSLEQTLAGQHWEGLCQPLTARCPPCRRRVPHLRSLGPWSGPWSVHGFARRRDGARAWPGPACLP